MLIGPKYYLSVSFIAKICIRTVLNIFMNIKKKKKQCGFRPVEYEGMITLKPELEVTTFKPYKVW